MLTLELMEQIEIRPVPWAQILTAGLFLAPIYNWPGRRTEITVEHLERIPRRGRVILALNHTDRFNYWPLQYRLWREFDDMYTVTWVKGKYFNKPAMAAFMAATNNIPTPSRGYLITCDVLNTLGEPPSSELYRVLRDELDAHERDLGALRERASGQGVGAQVRRLLETPRDLLGLRFDPQRESYFEAMDRLFSMMMRRFVALNEQALDMGHKIIVFPEGTRSLRLTKGRPGLAQMALRMDATVVPIGCNGSDDLYPGNSPISRGGEVVYRVGEPLTPEGELAPFAIDEPYVPFTHEAERAHGETFAAMTELLMERIAALLDPRYLPEAGETTEVQGAKRFIE